MFEIRFRVGVAGTVDPEYGTALMQAVKEVVRIYGGAALRHPGFTEAFFTYVNTPGDHIVLRSPILCPLIYQQPFAVAAYLCQLAETMRLAGDAWLFYTLGFECHTK